MCPDSDKRNKYRCLFYKGEIHIKTDTKELIKIDVDLDEIREIVKSVIKDHFSTCKKPAKYLEVMKQIMQIYTGYPYTIYGKTDKPGAESTENKITSMIISENSKYYDFQKAAKLQQQINKKRNEEVKREIALNDHPHNWWVYPY